MNKAFTSAVAATTLLVLPLVASAQSLTNIPILIGFVGDTINRLIPVVIALAVLVFFWGLAMYIFKAGGKGGKGKEIMIAGLLGLFVMVSLWGIIRLMQNTLGVSTAPVTIPQVPQRT